MSLAGQKVVITGATGFLGGALAQRLITEGAHVRLIARSPNKADALRKQGAEVVQGDLTDLESLHEAVKGCEIVFHVAVDYTNYQRQRQVNIEGTCNLAQAAAQANVKRFIHISTVAAYGSHVSGNVTEETPLRPVAYPYALTKAEGEQRLVKFASQHNLPYTIIRPAMIYGANASMWTLGMFKIAHLRPQIWLDQGGGKAHPIHVNDVVDLMVHAAQHPAAHNQAFNCAPDPSPTWREFLTHYAQLKGSAWKPIPLKPLILPIAHLVKLFSPAISTGKDLPALANFAMRDVTFSMAKARDSLGWSPKVSLEDGIISCVPSLKEHGLL